MAEERASNAGTTHDRVEEGVAQSPETGTASQDANNPPDIFVCPISREIMRDPVVLVETGQVYDRHSIMEWFRMGHSTCPLTGAQAQTSSCDGLEVTNFDRWHVSVCSSPYLSLCWLSLTV